jgi:hypothetical protein
MKFTSESNAGLLAAVSQVGRQALPLAIAADSPPAIPIPTNANLIARAIDALDHVHERSAVLRRELQDNPPEPAVTVAVLSVAVASGANLSVENIESLAQAARSGQLPRRKSG